MRSFITLVTVWLIANASWAADSRQADTCPLKRLGSVDFSIVGDELLVPVTIKDHAIRMSLETSGITNVMWIDRAKELGVSTRPQPASAVMHFGKFRVTQIATVAGFSLGPVKFGKDEFFLIPGRDAADEAVVGSIGINTFGNVDFELDFANSKLNLYSQDHCPGAVVYWTDNYSSAKMTRGPLGNYYFPMELDGKKIESTLTTNRAANSIKADATKRLYGFDEKSSDIETEIDPTGGPRASFRPMTLTGQGIKITNVRIRLSTGKVPQNCFLEASGGDEHAAVYRGCMGGEAPLVLGLNVIRRLHLYFATKEQVLYFSDVGASK